MNEAGAIDAEQIRETEWQLSATDLTIVRQWLVRHDIVDGLTIESRPDQRIYDTYLDTEDWRVHRAGFALRLRDLPGVAEATLKDLVPHTSGPVTRREINQPLGSAEEISLTEGDGPVSSRVQAVAGPRPLRPLFRVRTHRQRFAVLFENQQAGEIALDATLLASADGRSTVQLQRVEVEASAEGTPGILEGLVERLRIECSLQPALTSKFEVGLQSSGLRIPEARNLGATWIGPTSSIAEVACANLRRHMMSWLTCEPAARFGENPERLEELRAAASGLRSTIRIFEAHLPKAWSKLRRRLKSVQHLIDTVQALNLALHDLDEFATQHGEAGQLALQTLRLRTLMDHANARTRMSKAIDKASTQRMMGRLITQLSGATLTNGDSENLRVADFAAALIGKRYQELRPTRRRVERLREAIDAFENVHGEAAEDMKQALGKLEDLLTSLEATEFAAGRIQACVASESTVAATAFLLGMHFEQLRGRRGQLRRRVPKLLGKVQGRRWKTLRQSMAQP